MPRSDRSVGALSEMTGVARLFSPVSKQEMSKPATAWREIIMAGFGSRAAQLSEQHIRRTTDFALREMATPSDPSIGGGAPAPRGRATAAVKKTKTVAKARA